MNDRCYMMSDTNYQWHEAQEYCRYNLCVQFKGETMRAKGAEAHPLTQSKLRKRTKYRIVVIFFVSQYSEVSYAAFTLIGFDDQERNLTFVKTDLKILELKFHTCSFKQAFYLLHKMILHKISRDFDNTKILLNKFFVRNLVVKPVCVKRGISDLKKIRHRNDITKFSIF